MGPLPALLSYQHQLRGSCEVLTQFHTTGRISWEGHLAEYLTQILPPFPPLHPWLWLLFLLEVVISTRQLTQSTDVPPKLFKILS